MGLGMSVFGGKADVNPCVGECPLLAISGLSPFLNSKRILAHGDADGGSRPPNQGLAYDLSRLSVVAHLVRPEVVLLEKRGDAFEHIPCGFQLGLVVISSQVLD